MDGEPTVGAAQDQGATGSQGRAPLLVIAAGGTGGHMFPAEALAQEMVRRGWRVALSTDARGARFAAGFPEEVERREVQAAALSGGGVLGKVKAGARIVTGVAATVRWFLADRPAVVAGFGGYPSFPAMLAAGLLRRPTLIHEQNGVLGRVNQLFAQRVDALACGVWPTIGAPDRPHVQYVGNPIREGVRALAAATYRPPDRDGPIRLLVFGGSQGARVFADLVPAAITKLAPPFRRRLQVVQQVRAEDAEHVAAAYAAIGVSAELSAFFADMPRRIAEAHLVVSRAGASTVAELCAIGRPALLSPYPLAVADHQTANARALEGRMAAEILPEGATTPDKLAMRLGALFAEPERLGRMAAAALQLGRPGAGEDLADLVVRISRARRRARR